MKLNWLQSSVFKNSIAVIVVLGVGAVGVKLLTLSQAAAGATLSLSSASATVAPGGTLSVTIREDSGTDTVNSVQASLGYDSSQLQFTSLTEGTTFTTAAATSTNTPGLIRVGRATAGTPVSGMKDVVTVNFKVLAASGSSVGLTFDKNFSFVVRSTDNADILTTVTGATYTVSGNQPQTASMTLSPAVASAAEGSTVVVTVRENSGAVPVNAVQSTLTYDATKLQFIGLSEGNTFTNQAATDTSTAGRIRVARSLQQGSTGVSGDNAIVNLSFKVLSSSGTSSIGITKAESFVVSSSTNADILSAVSGSTYTFTTAPSQGAATLSMTPASGSYALNSTISVVIRATSATPMTTVQAAINYPAAQLQYVSTTEGGVFTTAQRTNSATSGLIDIVRGIPGGQAGVTGNQPVVTINFKVIGNSGSAALSYANATAVYDDSGTGTNVFNRSGSSVATYAITGTVATCTTNPSMPGTPSRTAFNYTTVNFSWTASTPGSNCTLGGYRVFRNGVVIANVTNGTTYNDTGLSASTTYNYSVVAYDTSSRSSMSSGTAALATKADDIAPTMPVGVTAAAPNAASVNLSWSNSVDQPSPGGVGVAGYRIYRNGSATPTYNVTTGTTFNDSNVTASTTYSYTVAAYDNLGNASAPSNVVTARTAAPTCSGKPTTPNGFMQTGATLTSVGLKWNASTPSAGCTLAGYNVFRGAELVGTTAQTTFNDTAGLSPNTSYTYTVRSYDTSANTSAMSTALTATTAADTAAPTAPAGVTAVAVSPGQVNIAWSASSDNVAVTGYRLYKNGTLYRSLGAAVRSFNDTGVVANTNYSYSVSAVDAGTNESTRTNAVPTPVRTPVATDTQAPTIPRNLRSTITTTSSVGLAWNASTDNVGVAGYRIYRSGTLVSDSTSLNYTVTGLTSNTDYTFTVRAFDASGNNSAASTVLSVRTLNPVVLIGDLNSDGVVDIYDLSIMLSNWQERNVPPRFGDINLDGVVNVFDLSSLLSHLGEKL